MNEEFKVERRKAKNTNIRLLVDEAKQKCKEFFKEEYKYCDEEAVEELGLDSELIDQLVEDYVIQIVKSSDTFEEYLAKLYSEQLSSKELDFTPLRELAHKNLGVARNLRIKDSQELLTTLMKSNDLKELEDSLDLLKQCVIKLKPISAYAALELLKIKNKLK
jgi:hypothetical protein